MKRDQFLRILNEECKEQGRKLHIEESEGKGSHYRVYVDKMNTIVKSGDLSSIYMNLVRRQLGLKRI